MICCDTCPFFPTCEEEEEEGFCGCPGLGESWDELDPFDAKFE